LSGQALTFYEGSLLVNGRGSVTIHASHSSIRASGRSLAQVGFFEAVRLPHLQTSFEPKVRSSAPAPCGAWFVSFLPPSKVVCLVFVNRSMSVDDAGRGATDWQAPRSLRIWVCRGPVVDCPSRSNAHRSAAIDEPPRSASRATVDCRP